MSDASTRSNLLVRIRSAHDADAWREFVEVYDPIIRAYARARGVPVQELDDLAQEVLQSVSGLIGQFEYDRARGRFRSWLRSVTHRRILRWRADQKRTPTQLGDHQLDARIGATDLEMEEVWEREWRRSALARAMALVHGDFDPRTVEAFERYAVVGEPAADVAKRLGMTVSNVYGCKWRVLDRLRQEVEAIDD